MFTLRFGRKINLLTIVLLSLQFLVSCKDISSHYSKPLKSERNTTQETREIAVPLQPSNKRIVVVSKDGDGDYARIQDALDDSEPGDTIQVKEGVYVEGLHISRSGTRENPIALVNYPGHSPVIDPGGGTYPEDDNSLMVQWRAEWIILEGFEIRNGWDGIKVYDPHNTIRDNWIHDNRYQGILVVSTGDIFIEGNTVNNNGTAQGACYGESWGGESPRHCHGLYISNYTCAGAPNITVRGNKFRNHGGTGIAWNGSSCTSKIRNTLVENNILENNSWGMSFYYNVEGSVIRNNTLVIEDYPETDNTSHNFIVMWESSGNEIRNNIFYSTREDVLGVRIKDEKSTQNVFDNNLWHIKSRLWVWGGHWRKDFNTEFENVIRQLK